ncbi:glycoside hydrolase superfamily [Chlamydoabsidia padenii]|nr:glycoside hydrolase superfamily [Chlamydoabsidia padenii]
MHFSTLISTVMTLVCTTGLVQAAPIQARGDNGLYGITYTARNSDGSCQSAQQVYQYVKDFKSSGIMNIRTYSQECNQLTHIINAIASIDPSMSVTAAVWLDGSSGDEKEIKQLASNLKSAGSKSSVVNSITVGNEVLQSGSLSSQALISNIHKVKQVATGIPVGTVDTPGALTPSVIDASDVIGVNIHPYFSKVDISKAASNMVEQYRSFVSKKSKGKSVYVSETGWPSAGKKNGAAVPSVANVQSYVKQLETISDVKYYYFEALDSNWKDGGDNGVETHFGLKDASGKSKVAL